MDYLLKRVMLKCARTISIVVLLALHGATERLVWSVISWDSVMVRLTYMYVMYANYYYIVFVTGSEQIYDVNKNSTVLNSEIHCFGSESSILECNWNGTTSNNSRRAGVKCGGKTL